MFQMIEWRTQLIPGPALRRKDSLMEVIMLKNRNSGIKEEKGTQTFTIIYLICTKKKKKALPAQFGNRKDDIKEM